MTFFDEQSVFVTEGTTGNWTSRLNARHGALIARNREHIFGKHVLDVGCHDGRWMHASLASGALHVTGVEGRDSASEKCTANLSALGHDRNQFTVLTENVMRDGAWCARSYDTALVLGILYHVQSPFDLLRRVAQTNPQAIVIDTAISLDPFPSLRLQLERSADPGSGIPEEGETAQVLVVHPSKSAVELMLKHLGYAVAVQQITVDDVEEKSAIANVQVPGINPRNPLGDYLLGKRLIFVATRV